MFENIYYPLTKESRRLTNFTNDRLDLFKLAVFTYNKKHGKCILYISEIANYGENDEFVNKGSSSLHSLNFNDKGDFWDLFHELESVVDNFNKI